MGGLRQLDELRDLLSEGDVDLVERGGELVVVEVLELERAREHDLPVLEAEAAMHQRLGVDGEELLVELAVLRRVSVDVADSTPAPTFWIWRSTPAEPTDTVDATALAAVLPPVRSNTPVLPLAETEPAPKATSLALTVVALLPSASESLAVATAFLPSATELLPVATATGPMATESVPMAVESASTELAWK